MWIEDINGMEGSSILGKKGIGANKKDMEKMCRVLDHKGVRNMEFAFRNAGRMDAQVSKMI